MGARRRPLPPEVEARLRELHAAGHTNVEIADALGVADTTAGEWVRLLGLSPNRRPGQRGPATRGFWTEAKMEQGRKLAAELGASREAAALLGCTQAALREKAAAERWPRRDLNEARRTSKLARVARAKALRAAGWKRKAIAAELGVAFWQVTEYLGLADPEPGDAPAPIAVPAPKPTGGMPKGTRAPRRTIEAVARPGWPKMRRCLGPCGEMRLTPSEKERMCGCHKGIRIYDPYEHAIAGRGR